MTVEQGNQIIAQLSDVITYADFYYSSLPWLSGLLCSLIFAVAWGRR